MAPPTGLHVPRSGDGRQHSRRRARRHFPSMRNLVIYMRGRPRRTSGLAWSRGDGGLRRLNEGGAVAARRLEVCLDRVPHAVHDEVDLWRRAGRAARERHEPRPRRAVDLYPSSENGGCARRGELGHEACVGTLAATDGADR